MVPKGSPPRRRNCLSLSIRKPLSTSILAEFDFSPNKLAVRLPKLPLSRCRATTKVTRLGRTPELRVPKIRTLRPAITAIIRMGRVTIIGPFTEFKRVWARELISTALVRFVTSWSAIFSWPLVCRRRRPWMFSVMRLLSSCPSAVASTARERTRGSSCFCTRASTPPIATAATSNQGERLSSTIR